MTQAKICNNDIITTLLLYALNTNYPNKWSNLSWHIGNTFRVLVFAVGNIIFWAIYNFTLHFMVVQFKIRIYLTAATSDI